MAKNIKDTFTLSQLIKIFGYEDYLDLGLEFFDAVPYGELKREAEERLDADDYDTDDDYERAVENLIDELRLKYEQELESSYYDAWLSTVETGIDSALASVGLQATDVTKKGQETTYKISPAPGKTYTDAAKEIIEIINGVGYFHFGSVKEFTSSGPYTLKEGVLSHLHWIPEAEDVYGDGYGPKWFSRQLERAFRYL
jgi:hypothetical protein